MPLIIENFSEKTPARPAPQAQQADPSEGPQEGDRIFIPEEMPMPAPAQGSGQRTSPLDTGEDCADVPLQGTGYPVIDGGGGVDTVIYGEGGLIVLDGSRFRSMEKVVLRNNALNMIRVKAGGLASLENSTLFIEGDPGLDTVMLDPCLSWKRPEKGSGGDRVYETSDGKAFVVVNEGVVVIGGN